MSRSLKVALRERLYRQQHGKCCYCESDSGRSGRDVEHFRPSAVYWWLAWSWSNLLFSCDMCNRTKSDYFPLRTSTTLQPERPAPGSERPWLLDPALRTDDDPIQHIEFRRVQPEGVHSERWRPFPRNGSRRGREVIAAVGLDRADLLERYKKHVATMADAIQALRGVFLGGDAAAIAQHWEHVIRRRWLSASLWFTALSRDVLPFHFGREIAHFGLDCSIHYPAK